MKNKLQPTRTSFSRNFQCKKAPCWLSKFFHFVTENRVDQLKKPPCTSQGMFLYTLTRLMRLGGTTTFWCLPCTSRSEASTRSSCSALVFEDHLLVRGIIADHHVVHWFCWSSCYAPDSCWLFCSVFHHHHPNSRHPNYTHSDASIGGLAVRMNFLESFFYWSLCRRLLKLMTLHWFTWRAQWRWRTLFK